MTARAADLARLPASWPLMLSADQAALYIGVARNTFLAWVERGALPGPAKLPGRRRLWHRPTLEATLAGGADDWRRRQERWIKRREDRSPDAR